MGVQTKAQCEFAVLSCGDMPSDVQLADVLVDSSVVRCPPLSRGFRFSCVWHYNFGLGYLCVAGAGVLLGWRREALGRWEWATKGWLGSGEEKRHVWTGRRNVTHLPRDERPIDRAGAGLCCLLAL